MATFTKILALVFSSFYSHIALQFECPGKFAMDILLSNHSLHRHTHTTTFQILLTSFNLRSGTHRGCEHAPGRWNAVVLFFILMNSIQSGLGSRCSHPF